jgi:hypothetical protein
MLSFYNCKTKTFFRLKSPKKREYIPSNPSEKILFSEDMENMLRHLPRLRENKEGIN